MESFAILIDAREDGTYKVTGKLLRDNKSLGHHHFPDRTSEADLRHSLMVALNNWLDTRVHRNKDAPTGKIDIRAERMAAMADFNKEMGGAVSMGMKEVEIPRLSKSTTDDQSLRKHTEPNPLPRKREENLQRRPDSLEGQRPPVEPTDAPSCTYAPDPDGCRTFVSAEPQRGASEEHIRKRTYGTDSDEYLRSGVYPDFIGRSRNSDTIILATTPSSDSSESTDGPDNPD